MPDLIWLCCKDSWVIWTVTSLTDAKFEHLRQGVSRQLLDEQRWRAKSEVWEEPFCADKWDDPKKGSYLGVDGGLVTDRWLARDLVVSKQRNWEEMMWEEVWHTWWTTVPLKMKASGSFEASRATNQLHGATRRNSRIRRNSAVRTSSLANLQSFLHELRSTAAAAEQWQRQAWMWHSHCGDTHNATVSVLILIAPRLYHSSSRACSNSTATS
jgi:hypothetical protein